jgi:DNA polymerase III delta prime subunit
MHDLPPLAASNVIVTPASAWPLIWESYASTVHASDRIAPEEWAKPMALKEIRNLQYTTGQQAVGKGRMIAIPCADQLSRETANALLKLLEEPPAGITFILFAETDRLLTTIRSRVRSIAIPSDAISSQRLIQYYHHLNALLEPEKTRRFLYYAPLFHGTLQSDIVLDAFPL